MSGRSAASGSGVFGGSRFSRGSFSQLVSACFNISASSFGSGVAQDASNSPLGATKPLEDVDSFRGALSNNPRVLTRVGAASFLAFEFLNLNFYDIFFRFNLQLKVG